MRYFVLILFSFTSFFAFAQKEVKVSGTYTYYAHESQTLEQAKVLALQFAQAEAMSNAFGTHVAMQTSNIMNGQTSHFSQISDTDVRGIWIRDTKKPVFKKDFWEHGFYVVCSVEGVAREITSATIPYKSQIMCNGFGKRYERLNFKNEDDLYLMFQSPVDGYLCVYLLDSEHTMHCMLPYYGQSDGMYEIKADKEYRLFSEKEARGTKDATYVDEYQMTTNQELEVNILYVVFSPNKFYKAVDKKGINNQLRHLSFDEFNKWLGKCHKEDKDLSVRKYMLEIKK